MLHRKKTAGFTQFWGRDDARTSGKLRAVVAVISRIGFQVRPGRPARGSGGRPCAACRHSRRKVRPRDKILFRGSASAPAARLPHGAAGSDMTGRGNAKRASMRPTAARLLWASLLLPLAALFAAPAQAQTETTLVSNFGEATHNPEGIAENSDHVLVQQFTTGSSTYVVTAAQVDVQSIGGEGGTSPLQLRICPRGTGNFPDLDNCLGTLSRPATLGTGEQRFDSTGDTITLAASTRYFLVAVPSLQILPSPWTRRSRTGRHRSTGGASRTMPVNRVTTAPPGPVLTPDRSKSRSWLRHQQRPRLHRRHALRAVAGGRGRQHSPAVAGF